MKFAKYQRGYLGAQNDTLDERASYRCTNSDGALPTPYWFVPDPEDNLSSDTGRQKPKVAYLDDTRALVIYTNTGSVNILYYRVVTVDNKGQATWGSEQTLVSGNGTINSYGLCHIRDDKVLIGYKHATGGTNTYCDVGTVDVNGDMTFATPTVIDTTFNPDTGRSWLEMEFFTEGKAVVSAPNSDNFKTSLQVVLVDVSDTITFGSVVKTTGTNKATQKLARLSATDGVVASGGVFTNSSAVAEYFSISTSTITLNGTEYVFTNNTQYPSPISDQFFIGDVVGIGDTQAMLSGGSTITDAGVTTHGITSMVLEEASGALTSASALQDLTSSSYVSSPTTIAMSSVSKDNYTNLLTVTNTVGDYTLDLVRYTQASPPVYVEHTRIAESANITYPDSDLLGSKRAVNAWTEVDGSANSRVAVNGVYFP